MSQNLLQEEKSPVLNKKQEDSVFLLVASKTYSCFDALATKNYTPTLWSVAREQGEAIKHSDESEESSPLAVNAETSNC